MPSQGSGSGYLGARQEHATSCHSRSLTGLWKTRAGTGMATGLPAPREPSGAPGECAQQGPGPPSWSPLRLARAPLEPAGHAPPTHPGHQGDGEGPAKAGSGWRCTPPIAMLLPQIRGGPGNLPGMGVEKVRPISFNSPSHLESQPWNARSSSSSPMPPSVA